MVRQVDAGQPPAAGDGRQDRSRRRIIPNQAPLVTRPGRHVPSCASAEIGGAPGTAISMLRTPAQRERPVLRTFRTGSLVFSHPSKSASPTPTAQTDESRDAHGSPLQPGTPPLRIETMTGRVLPLTYRALRGAVCVVHSTDILMHHQGCANLPSRVSCSESRTPRAGEADRRAASPEPRGIHALPGSSS